MKSKILPRATLFSALSFFVLTSIFLFQPRVSAVSASETAEFAASSAVSFGLEDDEYEIFELINQERRRKGLSALYWDDDLARMARNYSRKMARENFFSHYDSDGDSVSERATRSRVTGWRKIGENLFYAQGMSNNFQSLAVRGWMRSPSHRQNILDRAWTDSGIGIAKTRDGRIYVTQVFLKR